MAGNPANAPVWAEADVFLGAPDATIPTTNVAYDTDDWDAVGLLDDDNPFDAGEETIDKTDHSAFGYGVYASTYKNQTEKFTFTALETTLITLGILYDASGVTGTTTLAGDLARRDPSKTYRIGLEKRNGGGIERRTSKNYAYIDSIARNQADGKTTYTVTVIVAPDADQKLWYYYKGAAA